jgi:hypothetical protein
MSQATVEQEIVDRVSAPILLSYICRELYYRGLKKPHYGKRAPDERK